MKPNVRKNERALRNRVVAVIDVVGWTAALFFAYAIRFEHLTWPAGHLASFLKALPLALVVKFMVFHRAGLYRRLWRYAGMVELERILTASAVAGAILVPVWVWILPAVSVLRPRVPLSVAVIDAIFTAAVAAAPRFFIRWLSWVQHRRRDPANSKRVIIVGAGSAGELIAKELIRSSDLGLIPVGFVDDDPAKHGQEMIGLKVLGPLSSLVDFRERFRVDEIIVAMPTAAGTVIRSIFRTAAAAGIKARTIPGMFEILSGRVNIATLRPIQIEDLLRREPVRTDLDRVQELITDRCVLVTGAGGSIGSELCRQVASLQPRSLIVMGHGENSIFNITAELTERFPSLDVIPLIADVRDRDRIVRLMATYQPSIVFHAAAHKHVPLMEINVAEAVTNNILGTRNVTEAAAAAGVEHFVMISTDKAVRPTNVMGATKRVAEQIVQEVGARHELNFIAVRFGNVLGSRGSVVPVFLRQIESGGPVTVTHPEMRRYFMTIPEAVQLVLQAAVLGRGREVFVLDMGEPVKIVDLATDLIRLSGLEVGRDVEIHFTGVRPGEKLYEELFFGREHAEATEHPKVLRANHAELPIGLATVVEDLIVKAQRGVREDDLRELLRRLVPDYRPEGSAHNISSLRGGAADQPATPLFRDLGSA